MKPTSAVILVGLLLLGVGAGSYWLGTHSTGEIATTVAASTERKVLYYRNPMGLPDTSPVPKKDAMGMDYVPVFDGDAVQGEAGAVNISVEKVQKLGVQSETAMLRSLDKTIQVTGLIAIDESRTFAIAPKFEGWVEKLHVNTSGQSVSKGQALFDVYSPELVSAQREYDIAVQGMTSLEHADEQARNSMKQLAEASQSRLKNWDISQGDLKHSQHGKSSRNLTYYSPVSGIVLDKQAVQGMRFMPGETLYRIADLSSVWVLAEVPERDIALVAVGNIVQISIEAYPAKVFTGKVSFIYPTLNAATRTVQVRVEIANPKGLLKPAMFANVSLPVGDAGKVLTVPTSAVIDSGKRQVVLVQLAEGRYVPRDVKLGRRGGEYVEVLEGLAEGEKVVTSALFLIDAESNLKSALSGFGSKPALVSESAVPVHSLAALPEQNKAEAAKAVGVGHQGQGVLDAINQNGSVRITHQAIQSLDWPGMSMDFELANSSLTAGITPGSAISFELVERAPGEWVITSIQPRNRHEGH